MQTPVPSNHVVERMKLKVSHCITNQHIFFLRKRFNVIGACIVDVKSRKIDIKAFVAAGTVFA